MIVIGIAMCPEGKELRPLSSTTSLIWLKTAYGLGLSYVNFKIATIIVVKNKARTQTNRMKLLSCHKFIKIY